MGQRPRLHRRQCLLSPHSPTSQGGHALISTPLVGCDLTWRRSSLHSCLLESSTYDSVVPASALLGWHLPPVPCPEGTGASSSTSTSFKTHQRAVLGRVPLLPSSPNHIHSRTHRTAGSGQTFELQFPSIWFSLGHDQAHAGHTHTEASHTVGTPPAPDVLTVPCPSSLDLHLLPDPELLGPQVPYFHV